MGCRVSYFLIPLTSAALLSQVCEMLLILSLSTLVGPPWAYTPVYSALSSCHFTASAFVPLYAGPPEPTIFAFRSASETPFLAAHSVSPFRNWSYFILFTPFSANFAKARSITCLLYTSPSPRD
eukprot:TRINITY_DN375_c0_g1_i7.p1 TRINITY_DN375_c0_g1~~TRINITY_DN375_c0_g1_i7.p1  ORF type:complete len:124 (-),score=9.36 TRINITY_DN375_c0_g1_i7:53-424(-)